MKKLSLVLALTAACFTTTSMADDYIGIQATRATIGGEVGYGWALNGGWSAGGQWGVAARGNSWTVKPSKSVEVSTTNFSIGPSYKISNRMAVYVLAGGGYDTVEAKVGNKKGDDSSFNFVYGVGLTYAITDRFGLEGSYERTTVDVSVLNKNFEYSVNSFSLGATYSF